MGKDVWVLLRISISTPTSICPTMLDITFRAEKMMSSYVLGFHDLDRTKFALAGGKGANLGELSRIEGIQVPAGFCVTTKAYKEIVGNNAEFDSLLERLAVLKANDRKEI